MKTHITPGIWLRGDSYDGGKITFSHPESALTPLVDVYTGIGRDEAEANAKLIVEAGTVANETGLTPRQLQALNAELVEALEEMVNTFTAGGMHLIRLHAIETLARAKSNP